MRKNRVNVNLLNKAILSQIKENNSDLLAPKKNKFNAKRTTYNGISFHSKKEAEYCAFLDLQKNAVDPSMKVIGYERQVRYDLTVNGVHICFYDLDFMVIYEDQHLEHLDVKGYKSGSSYALFKLKKQLMKAIYNIDVKEV